MSESYDVIIVGAGPSGASAARILAGQGFSVALLDRALFPRKKLCGGLLTWKSVRVLERVFGLDEAALKSQGLVNFESSSYSLLYQGRKVLHSQGSYPFLLVERAVFDHRLLTLAEEAGATVFQGMGATHCIPATGVVATANGREFSAKFIIGADGANSRMRRSLGVGREAWYANLAQAVEFHVDRDKVPARYRDLAEPELHVGFIKAGYGWVFPNREQLCIGMCGLEKTGKDFQVHFREFLAMLGLDPTSVDLKGHPLPYGNWLNNPCQEKLLLAGDAAGFVEPLLGEGIFCALMTGRYAAEAVANALETGVDPALAYRRRLARYIVPELKGASLLRSVFLKSINLVGYGPFNLFMRLAATPLTDMVHGHRSYLFMRKKSWDF